MNLSEGEISLLEMLSAEKILKEYGQARGRVENFHILGTMPYLHAVRRSGGLEEA